MKCHLSRVVHPKDLMRPPMSLSVLRHNCDMVLALVSRGEGLLLIDCHRTAPIRQWPSVP